MLATASSERVSAERARISADVKEVVAEALQEGICRLQPGELWGNLSISDLSVTHHGLLRLLTEPRTQFLAEDKARGVLHCLHPLTVQCDRAQVRLGGICVEIKWRNICEPSVTTGAWA